MGKATTTAVTYEGTALRLAREYAADAARTIHAQAARIAELEAALRQIEADCDADYPPSTGAIKYAARAALEGGKE